MDSVGYGLDMNKEAGPNQRLKLGYPGTDNQPFRSLRRVQQLVQGRA